MFFIIVISLFDFFYRDIESYRTVIIDFLKLIIFGSGSTLLVQNCEDKEKLVRNYIIVSCIYASYLYIQIIAYYGAGIFLPNVYSIGPLRPLYDAYSWDYQQYVEIICMARPASFMNEPAFYSSFICITLGIILFDAHNITFIQKHKGVFIAFFLISIILSTSTSGMIYACIVIFVYLLSCKRYTAVISGLTIVAVLMVISYSSSLQQALESNRLYEFTLKKLINITGQARVGNGVNLLSDISFNDLLFGYGYGNVKTYSNYDLINSSVTILLSTGIVGCILWIRFGAHMLLKYRCKLSWLYIALFFIASLGSGVINIQGIYYFGIAVAVHENVIQKNPIETQMPKMRFIERKGKNNV